MTTVEHTVLDGTNEFAKITNEELGFIHRRVDEIKRRINEGTLPKNTALGALQKIVEGKPEALDPCTLRHRGDRIIFVRPPVEKRKLSRAPMRLRTESYLKRLFFHYKLSLRSGRFGRASKRQFTPEDIMAMLWEAENIPIQHLNGGSVPVLSILDSNNPPEREVAIVSSTLQWLGTNVGRDFLVRFIRTADILV